jgi:hypothetical protein
MRCSFAVPALVAIGGVLLGGCVVFDENLLKGDASPDVFSDTPNDPDAEADADRDVATDTPTDTLTDTPADTAPDVPSPAPVCVTYDHDCAPGPSHFYPGEANQDCTEVCATHGGYAGVPTTGIGSSAPDSERCRKILQTMYQSSAPVGTATHTVGLGCARLTGGTFVRYTSPNTTQGAKAATVQRVCACQQNDACQVFDDCP